MRRETTAGEDAMPHRRHDLLGTFSITALDEATGMLGVAVTSKAFSVGSLCPFALAGAGAVATQSVVNPLLGPAILELLAAGASAPEALEQALADDPRPGLRQLNVVDARGESATVTGSSCIPWCGGRTGRGYSLAGNILAGERVVEAMEGAWMGDDATGFGDRLVRVLEAGEAAGGDARGRQSAALLIVHRTAVPCIRLQVDDHPDPVGELRRLWSLAAEPDPDDGMSFFDFIAAMAGDPTWTWPVDDDELEEERRGAEARLAADG